MRNTTHIRVLSALFLLSALVLVLVSPAARATSPIGGRLGPCVTVFGETVCGPLAV